MCARLPRRPLLFVGQRSAWRTLREDLESTFCLGQGYGELAALQRMLAQAAPAAAAVGAASPASTLAAWQGPRAPGLGQHPTPGAPADLASLGGQLAALAALHPGLLRALAYAPPPPLQQLVQPGAPAGAGGAAVAAPMSHPAAGALGQAGHMQQQIRQDARHGHLVVLQPQQTVQQTSHVLVMQGSISLEGCAVNSQLVPGYLQSQWSLTGMQQDTCRHCCCAVAESIV